MADIRELLPQARTLIGQWRTRAETFARPYIPDIKGLASKAGTRIGQGYTTVENFARPYDKQLREWSPRMEIYRTTWLNKATVKVVYSAASNFVSSNFSKASSSIASASSKGWQWTWVRHKKGTCFTLACLFMATLAFMGPSWARPEGNQN